MASSRPGCFIPSPYWIGGWKDHSVGLGILGKTRIFCPWRESNDDSSFVCPAASSLRNATGNTTSSHLNISRRQFNPYKVCRTSITADPQAISAYRPTVPQHRILYDFNHLIIKKKILIKNSTSFYVMPYYVDDMSWTLLLCHHTFCNKYE